MYILIYLILGFWFLHWAWNKWCDMEEREVEEEMEHLILRKKKKIIEDNYTAEEIQEFKKSNDTTSKDNLINDFIQGEN